MGHQHGWHLPMKPSLCKNIISLRLFLRVWLWSSLHVCFWENSLASLNFSSHLCEQMNIQSFFFLKKKKRNSACVCLHVCSYAHTRMFVRVWAHVFHGYRPILDGLPLFPGLRQSLVYCCVCQAA